MLSECLQRRPWKPLWGGCLVFHLLAWHNILSLLVIPVLHNSTWRLGYLSSLNIHSYSVCCTLLDTSQVHRLWNMQACYLKKECVLIKWSITIAFLFSIIIIQIHFSLPNCFHCINATPFILSQIMTPCLSALQNKTLFKAPKRHWMLMMKTSPNKSSTNSRQVLALSSKFPRDICSLGFRDFAEHSITNANKNLTT